MCSTRPCHSAFTHQRQAECRFRFVTRESAGSVDDGLQLRSFRKFARFGGDTASDRFQFIAAGQVVLQSDKQLFQFQGNLSHRGQHDQNGALLFAQ
jgi:hypothetical protein